MTHVISNHRNLNCYTNANNPELFDDYFKKINSDVCSVYIFKLILYLTNCQ